MAISLLKKILPSWKNMLLAILASALLILAFPDFEIWFFAWFALVPLMCAVERETKLQKPELQKPARSKGVSHAIDSSIIRSFVLGWIFGTTFFFGTCWWLTYAPINYAAFPPILAYFLLFCVTTVAGLFPGIFAAILSMHVRRFGSRAFLAAPFVWVFTEFLRYLITGNNWNAIGYSQAFTKQTVHFSEFGGVLLVGFPLALFASLVTKWVAKPQRYWLPAVFFLLFWLTSDFSVGPLLGMNSDPPFINRSPIVAKIVAVQANVPMSGLDQSKWQRLRDAQTRFAEEKVYDYRHPVPTPRPDGRSHIDFPEPPETPVVVILPESPMNFLYSDDREFQQFIGDFARENNVSVLFNSSEPDKGTTKYFNSAVMVGPDGKQVDQYDKIYLLPFGEAVPSFLEGIVPGFVGNFAYGREYDLFPVGDAKAGVMICFESHFGALSREYVRNGADVIIEMTNDGYLGPTPVLRQHLANAVFRAVETNRPVLRVTNVGITAYIDEKGRVLDAATPYQEETRVWSVSKSDGSQTFYVKYGDWFAWLCSMITIGILLLTLLIKRPKFLKI
ncbi:MAG: apolipoprotein N-acyltransferase [Chloracidobacterium sp.]|nr:apolipoprotein N-acyltransferase [Chloracidobacterium sp.]